MLFLFEINLFSTIHSHITECNILPNFSLLFNCHSSKVRFTLPFSTIQRHNTKRSSLKSNVSEKTDSWFMKARTPPAPCFDSHGDVLSQKQGEARNLKGGWSCSLMARLTSTATPPPSKVRHSPKSFCLIAEVPYPISGPPNTLSYFLCPWASGSSDIKWKQ